MFRGIRKFILIAIIFLAVGSYTAIKIYVPPQSALQTIRMTQVWALCAITLLYLTLLISPITKLFPSIPLRNHIIMARQSLGLGAFLFALLHGTNAFFFQLNGFTGLSYLNPRYLVAIILAITALTVLTILAITTPHAIASKLGKYWKMIHRLIYLAGMFVVVHALMLGTHTKNLSDTIPLIGTTLIIILFILEAMRLDLYITQKRGDKKTNIALITTCILITILIATNYNIWPTNKLSVHSDHKMQKPTPQPLTQQLESSQRKAKVNLKKPDSIQPKKDQLFEFEVTDEKNTPITLFQVFHEKVAHLIIVNDNLTYFNHVHPEQKNNIFSINTINFPQDDSYRMYLDFMPFGATEQYASFVVSVGKQNEAEIPIEIETTKINQGIKIIMNTPQKIKAQKLQNGTQTINFNTYFAENGEPLDYITPYLGAKGHLVMINNNSYDYLHIHPTDSMPNMTQMQHNTSHQAVNEIEFMANNVAQIKPGPYTAFLEFKRGDQYIVQRFSIELE